jgi:low affinity Fe/Cu permease
MRETFRKIAKSIADWTGSAGAFALAFITILAWAITGPLFHYSDDWQLVINTGTSVVTFLMVFIIQNAQNRESRILHLKIDELIRSNETARNELINLDEHTDEELTALHGEFVSMKNATSARLDKISKIQESRRR